MPRQGFEVGVHSWTLRNLNFEEMVDFARQHGLKRVGLSLLFDPQGSREESLRKPAILRQNGLEAYMFGVAETSWDQAVNRRLFETAKPTDQTAG